MSRVIAVSGGVDSIALLHMLSKQFPDERFIVAHFDHGIRDDSSADALFVRQLAEKYNYEFVMRREELGAKASEELARSRRYDFLRTVTERNNTSLIAAHHLDDLVETVAINFTRGTGWRGLTPFGAAVERPLLHMTKADILDYAMRHKLEWREDSTNSQDVYLRNRLRRKVQQLAEEEKREIHALYAHQRQLRVDIRLEVEKLVGVGPDYDRYKLMNMSEPAAMECLRYITKAKLTRPQLARLLHAIKVAKPGATYQAGNGISVRFTTRYFTV